jgi:hypothetical protein
MAQTTGIHESAPPHTVARQRASTLRKVGSKIKLVVTRSIFWAYERSSWQYDLICIAILAFIFLSPRSWFNDRPTLQLTNLRNQQGIVEMRRANKEVRYLVDARLVDTHNQKAEDAVPIILQQHLQKPFTTKSIDAVRDRNNVVLGYTVVVEE